MRRQHRGWGPRTILSRLARAGVSPLPSRSGIYRALVRHQLIDPKRRRRRPSDYKRWERSRAMELWQMDITLGVRLQDGSPPSIVTGIDDHSRFCVSAKVVARATARPVCGWLETAIVADDQHRLSTDALWEAALKTTGEQPGTDKAWGVGRRQIVDLVKQLHPKLPALKKMRVDGKVRYGWEHWRLATAVVARRRGQRRCPARRAAARHPDLSERSVSGRGISEGLLDVGDL